MIKHSIERAARWRFTVPTVVVMALLAAFVNEFTFQHTVAAVARAIALTDARLEATKALQAMTVMEAAARAALAHDHPHHRERFEAASKAFYSARQPVFGLIARSVPGGAAVADKLRQSSDAQISLLRGWLESATQVAANPAVQRLGPDADVRRQADLQAEFASALDSVAGAQHVARVSIYNALLLSRVAIHALVLVVVIALLLFVRELRQSDAERAREHGRLAKQIKDRTSHLHDLADHLVTVREDERASLARDLHDEMGGLMTAMKLELARLLRVPGVPAAAIEHVRGIDARLSDGIALKRRIIENLRPSSLDQLGLKVALELLCADLQRVLAVPVATDLHDVQLGNEKELTVFRVAQESLTNIAKYASAHKVQVRLTLDPRPGAGTVTLTVSDDGRGFDTSRPAIGRHGLLGMQMRVERHGGTFEVQSRIGSGTQIVVTLPVDAPDSSPPST